MSCQRDYDDLSSDRNIYLERARVAAAFTVPYLVPLAEKNNNQQRPQSWSGVGQEGVHNISSRLLLALLPPTETFFRLTIDEIEVIKHEREQLAAAGDDPTAIAKVSKKIADQRSKFEMDLARLEQAVLRMIETSNDRVAVHEMLLQCVVAGNALMYVGEKGLRCFHLNRYVLRRDPNGDPMLAIACEELSYDRLPEKVRQVLEQKNGSSSVGEGGEGDEGPADRDRTVKVYTRIEWKDKKVSWRQEVEGVEVPDSDGEAKLGESPWIPVRMYRIDGDSYGPGYVEAVCLADLRLSAALSQAIAEGSLVSAQVKHLVKPNSVTKAKELAEAPNGAYVEGNADDVTTVQVNKAADLQVAFQKSQEVDARLRRAFMIADVRHSERTTAEEVQLVAQQAEMSLGSVYSILTVEFQQPYVTRKLALGIRAGRLPKLPEMVKPVVSVGLAAVGRGRDLEKVGRFMEVLSQTLGPAAVATYINSTELIRRLAASLGINIIGLVKTEEDVAKEQQAAQQAAMAQQAMQAGMADPQKVANAAATVQQMVAPPPGQGATPEEAAA